jgi:hypothetical protein
MPKVFFPVKRVVETADIQDAKKTATPEPEMTQSKRTTPKNKKKEVADIPLYTPAENTINDNNTEQQ